MLYREPKLLKAATLSRERSRRSVVSVLYREPKLLKELERIILAAAARGFSALP